jgi:hypothetical protein
MEITVQETALIRATIGMFRSHTNKAFVLMDMP